MPDFLSFNEGRKELADNAKPATSFFLLSRKDCNTLLVTDTLVAAAFLEATGTGYARQSEATPAASAANPSVVAYAVKTWATGAAADWPSDVKAVILVTTVDNTGKAICAWNLVTGGTARAMNAAGTTLNFTPTLQLA